MDERNTENKTKMHPRMEKGREKERSITIGIFFMHTNDDWCFNQTFDLFQFGAVAVFAIRTGCYDILGTRSKNANYRLTTDVVLTGQALFSSWIS